MIKLQVFNLAQFCFLVNYVWDNFIYTKEKPYKSDTTFVKL